MSDVHYLLLSTSQNYVDEGVRLDIINHLNYADEGVRICCPTDLRKKRLELASVRHKSECPSRTAEKLLK